MHWSFLVLCAASLQAVLGFHDVAAGTPDIAAELGISDELPLSLDDHVLLLQSSTMVQRSDVSQTTTVNDTGSASQTTVAVSPAGIGCIIVAVILALCICYFVYLTMIMKDPPPGSAEEILSSEREKLDVEPRVNEPLDEDMYCLAVVTFIRDVQCICRDNEEKALRYLRMFSHLSLLGATIGVQIVLMIQIQTFVTPMAVSDIRNAYDRYELLMYGNQSNHTYMISTNRHRGISPKFFQPELFASLPDELKEKVCNIPFSQRSFFMIVLLIWSLTCVGQFKKCAETTTSILYATPTICSMSVSMQYDTTAPADGDIVKEKVIVGLTPVMKISILVMVLLPWLGITGYLLYLGSRWLAATNNFGELVLNAAALEFVLLLKDLIYATLIAERNKREVRNTFVLPTSDKEPAGYTVFLGALSWGFVAVAWIFLYVYKVQSVLPEYKWDVNGVCTPWLQHFFHDKPPPLGEPL